MEEEEEEAIKNENKQPSINNLKFCYTCNCYFTIVGQENICPSCHQNITFITPYIAINYLRNCKNNKHY